MAKTQSFSATMPPEYLSTSQGVYSEDALIVAETLNAAWGLSLGATHMDLITGINAWGASGNELATHSITFPTGSGYTTRYGGRIWIDPDADTITVRSRCIFPAANTGRVRVTIGGGNVVLTHTAGATTTDTDTLATSTSGTGLQAVTVEIDHQTGASGACYLQSLGIRTTAVTSGLPDPVE